MVREGILYSTAVFLATFMLFSIEMLAQFTLIPDSVFEQKLIDLGYDTGIPDGAVPTTNISTVTTLHLGGGIISPVDIYDLTGIEDFTALERLNCSYLNLTSLDLTSNSQLSHLHCSYNFIASLDLSANSNLSTLSCFQNSLTSLDVSNNLLLDTLSFSSTSQFGVSALDLSANVLLKRLWLSSHASLTSLDLSSNSALEYLYISNNGLTSLDLSNNPLLTNLTCVQNQLEYLNVANGNNLNLTQFVTTMNADLTCIQVDDESWSDSNWTVSNGNIDEGMFFDENCIPDAISEYSEFKMLVYPNPSTGIFTLEVQSLTDVQYMVIDLTGRLVLAGDLSVHKERINLEVRGQDGTYVLTIVDAEGQFQARTQLIQLNAR